MYTYIFIVLLKQINLKRKIAKKHNCGFANIIFIKTYTYLIEKSSLITSNQFEMARVKIVPWFL